MRALLVVALGVKDRHGGFFFRRGVGDIRRQRRKLYGGSRAAFTCQSWEGENRVTKDTSKKGRLEAIIRRDGKGPLPN